MKDKKLPPNFLFIFINAKDEIAYDEIENEMNHAVDWFRLDQKTWILYTTSNINIWMGRLKKLVEPEGSLFICKLEIEGRNGWMSKSFWEWLKSKKNI